MKLVGLNKVVPVALVALSLFTACGNNKFAKQTHGGSATANQYVTTKPKIDIVVFQDNSDSVMYGPINTLKPQMVSFLNSMSSQWDYHFTVLPLLSQQTFSYKYIVASDCNDISGVNGCYTTSQASAFNSLSYDYGWISSSNSQVGSADRGFKNMKAHLQSSSLWSTGFLRHDAALAVIVLSNGDDMEGVYYYDSDGDGTPTDPDYALNSASFNNYASYFGNIKGSSVLSKFYSVVSPGGNCYGYSSYNGVRYRAMSDKLKSRAYNLCNGELNSSLNDIKQQLVAVTEAIKFNYVVISTQNQPVVSSIKVWKNGVEIPSSNWTYVGYTTQATSYYPTSGNIQKGYMIKLNGVDYKGSDTITFDFDPL